MVTIFLVKFNKTFNICTNYITHIVKYSIIFGVQILHIISAFHINLFRTNINSDKKPLLTNIKHTPHRTKINNHQPDSNPSCILRVVAVVSRSEAAFATHIATIDRPPLKRHQWAARATRPIRVGNDPPTVATRPPLSPPPGRRFRSISPNLSIEGVYRRRACWGCSVESRNLSCANG